MIRTKKILFFTITIIVIFLLHSFLFGKLLPYSPIVIGFEKKELKNVVFYIEEGAKFNKFSEMDSYISLVENFHMLKFKRKPRVFLFENNNTYARCSFVKARFGTFYNGDIVVSPWAQKEAIEGLISMEIYLKHELSHSIIHQNSGYLQSSQYPEWLLEGIAMYSSNQMGTSWYPSKDKTYDYIQKGNFMPPNYFRTSKEKQIDLNVKNKYAFMYSEFACLVDYLIEKYGKDKIILYMKELTYKNKSMHNQVFKEIYGIDLNRCIQDFKESVDKTIVGRLDL